MINLETIKFVKMLDELATLSQNGIEPFENATEESFRQKVFYDVGELEEKGGYKIVLDACIVDDPQCYHHDIISYYDDHNLEYKIRVIIDEDSAYIEVRLLVSEEIIVIENGKWYFA